MPVENLVAALLRPASAVIATCGMLAIFLAVVGGVITSPVRAAVTVGVGLVVVVGGAVRLLRSPRVWGLASAVWSAAASMSLASSFGVGVPFPGAVLLAIGVAVAFGLTLLLIAAAGARRDRRPPASRLRPELSHARRGSG